MTRRARYSISHKKLAEALNLLPGIRITHVETEHRYDAVNINLEGDGLDPSHEHADGSLEHSCPVSEQDITANSALVFPNVTPEERERIKNILRDAPDLGIFACDKTGRIIPPAPASAEDKP